ncbi:MAG: energy-coupling factor transporter ATPase [Oscillospiraceae bacterium]|nr:energy-coupling factor transporter ATPase [Oscillospiraceae bacterium]
MNIISAQNVFFNYENSDKNIDILNNINLNIEQGEFVSILGHNGCGKSTLAKHLNGILSPTKGDVFIKNISTKDIEKSLYIKQLVGMVFQNPDNQLVATIVEEDVAFALENLGVPLEDMKKRVDKAIETVGMSDYKKHGVHQLSGGQKQRVAIAGILAMNPECIVLDEPTAMLDPSGRKEVMKTIIDLNNNHKKTIILITHYMEEAVLSKRVILMDKGKIISDNSPRDTFSNIELIKSIGLDLPQATELIYNLNKKHSLNFPNNILFEDECVEFLFNLLKKEL